MSKSQQRSDVNKQERYQVMAVRDPEGHFYYHIDNFADKAKANARARDMIRQGYRGVKVWDTMDNPLSDLLKL